MRLSKQILIIIIYNCAIWTTDDFDGWVAERGVQSNLLKTLLVSRGLFKSGMSSLTVRVVVDEDEFISTKQTPALAGESIKSIT